VGEEAGTRTLIFDGKTKEYMDNIGIKEALVSVSHDKNYAIANVILQA
jgi:phosphopantetheinyl transferase (holo-ACP synthase)